MNTFHSSGTASGNVEKMWTWNSTIPTTAIVSNGPLGATSNSSGNVNSVTVPMCAASAPVAEGSRSSGCLRQSRRLNARERFHGVLLTITVTTNGKWRFSFDDAAPHQMHTNTICAPASRSENGNRKRIIRFP